jgi:hypothetical protein
MRMDNKSNYKVQILTKANIVIEEKKIDSLDSLDDRFKEEFNKVSYYAKFIVHKNRSVMPTGSSLSAKKTLSEKRSLKLEVSEKIKELLQSLMDELSLDDVGLCVKLDPLRKNKIKKIKLYTF